MIEGYQDLPMSHKRCLVAQILSNQQLCEALANNVNGSYEDLSIALGMLAKSEVNKMSDRAIEEVIEVFNKNAQSYEHATVGEFFN